MNKHERITLHGPWALYEGDETDLAREFADDWTGPIPLTLRPWFARALLAAPFVVAAILWLVMRVAA
jgi:hypothetical protein